MIAIAVLRGCCAVSAYSLIPFLSIWLLATEGAGAKGGALAGTFIFCYRSGALLYPPLILWIGERRCIQFMLILSLISFSGFFFVDARQIWFQAACLAVAGMSLSGVILSLRTSAGSHSDSAARLDAYSMLSVGANCGAAIGPFFGGLVAASSPKCLGVVVCLPLAIGYLFRANVLESHACKSVDGDGDDRLDQTNWRITKALVITSIGTWFAHSQVFMVLAASLHSIGQESWAPWLYATNSALVIILQRKVTRRLSFFEKRFQMPSITGLLIGNAITAVSLVGMHMGVGFSVVVCLLSMIVFTFGEMAWCPVFEREIASNCHSRTRPSVLAAVSVARGISESLGATIGLAFVHFELSPFLLGAASSALAVVWLLQIVSQKQDAVKQTS